MSKEQTLEERRAALELRLLDEARRLLDKLHQPMRTRGFSAGKVLGYTMPEPSTTQAKELVIAAAVMIDKSLVLARFAETKNKDGYAAVDAFIANLMGQAPTPTGD